MHYTSDFFLPRNVWRFATLYVCSHAPVAYDIFRDAFPTDEWLSSVELFI